MQLGIDVLLKNKKLLSSLQGKKIALLGHPASMTGAFEHTLDALFRQKKLNVVCTFGPQHGMRGEKQDNMIESEDELDPVYRIPVFSLYGKVRRPTDEMMSSFDVLLVDIQDLGTRIYTFITTLLYLLEACARHKKPIWILDRPNPAGRPVEGSLLKPGYVSFVGALEGLPMRHGLTMGELTHYFVKRLKLDVDYRVIGMKGYAPLRAPGFGWPSGQLNWVNPSPNAAALNMARVYPGTVLIEATHLSEGRGTTHPLETIGAPGLEIGNILKQMQKLAPRWMGGCRIRPCYFQPTFQKHKDLICSGFQIHTDDADYAHERFKPYRLVSLFLKTIRLQNPAYAIWHQDEYEYEKDRPAIDLISGGEDLRKWVDDPEGKTGDFEKIQLRDERIWLKERRKFLIY